MRASLKILSENMQIIMFYVIISIRLSLTHLVVVVRKDVQTWATFLSINTQISVVNQ